MLVMEFCIDKKVHNRRFSIIYSIYSKEYVPECRVYKHTLSNRVKMDYDNGI